ncbi:transcriptional regulator [Bifidobacterium dolichotidis]|uniref:Transcriptional regulator n=1 Tax=Bifidobacterium dolichotidis TaxID=2306976 RepID=A0A430FQU4_9BIFI|nr:LacI family DNA-binding transcriptional regulator [Bifidobacterium dolichotidis]RSX55191.1 transcriptional regulator [Bifidobacterium dolichotidis]
MTTAPRNGASRSAKVTIKDVAKLAGVAISTTSRVLNGGTASEATRAKVREAARQLNYMPNAAARQLPSGHSNIVALVIDEPSTYLFQDDYIVSILGELSLALSNVGLLPFLALASPEDSESFRRLLSQSGAAGVIVASLHEGHNLAKLLTEFGKPAVFIGRPPTDMHFPYVDVDNYEGGFLAGQVLLERGCRNIAIISGPKDMVTPRERAAGTREALAQHGLEPIAVLSGDYELENGAAAMKRLLQDHPEVDGVVAQSDKLAAGVIRILSEAGKEIPNDIAVVGFDNLQVARLLNPPLTTIEQPLTMVARGATRMLKNHLDTGEWDVRSQTYPVRLVKRTTA